MEEADKQQEAEPKRRKRGIGIYCSNPKCEYANRPLLTTDLEEARTVGGQPLWKCPNGHWIRIS